MPEEKKEKWNNPLVDEDGNFVGKLYPVTWSKPRKEEPKPEPIPVGEFLMVLIFAFVFMLALLGVVAALT